MLNSRFFLVLSFILIGVISRLLPHPPNFTALNALALFATCHINSLPLAIGVLFSTLFLSDIILGFHPTMFVVYLSLSLIVLMGSKMKQSVSFFSVTAASLISSFLFFLITNFGVWLTNALYAKTASGLFVCYVAAVPFLMNGIAGDLVYNAVLFGMFYALQNFSQKNTHQKYL